ncbi:CoA transferase [Bacillus sp. AGMB 02131]|uniref:CoA transferase n=1 Tax=Peribacillus faecalis TaxID=2772559 RepID=A0A927CTU7_9BACI|nr:CaiB/BaiF CoA-transferase family protein [Peribacillus faecalis]MBD3107341.1 CoA transferase [Peribacillus faecalis]
MTEKALSGIKVIDLSWNIAGPYCTKLLADYGAEIIKIEQPEIGDPSRLEGPFPNDVENINASGLYAFLNNNKHGITLNLKTERSASLLKALVKDADVLVENFSPGFLSGLGLGYENLKQINPKLVMTSISNFGQSGEYKDYKATELITQAMNGFVSQIGDKTREPLRAGGALRLTEYSAGTIAAASTLAAVLGRKKTNEGTHVDVSIAECGVIHMPYRNVQHSYTTCASFEDRYISMPSIEKCKDGYIGINLLSGQHWQDFCYMTEMYDWVEDPRFMEQYRRVEPGNKELFRARFDEWLMRHTKEEIIQLGIEWRIPITPVINFEEMLDFPQYKEREFFVKVNHPIMGEVEQPGPPFRLSETPWSIEKVAPLLGEDNKRVFGEILGYSEEEIQEMSAKGII